MALPSDKKQTIITKFATAQGDTGSPEVQIALLTAKIGKLADHLKLHSKDVHSRKGLLAMVSKRRRLLYYLLKQNEDRYKNVVQQLDLKK